MSITLHYFNTYGRAEPTRMILHSHNISFTDDRLDDSGFQDFIKTGQSEFGQVPCLEIDGYKLVESRAIERYLLKKFGVHTQSHYEEYLNDSTISFLDDMRSIVEKFIFVDNNLQGLQQWFQSDMPWYLKHLNARVNENYLFVSFKPHHADWAVFQIVWDGFLRSSKAAEGRPMLEEHAPKLIEFAERFKNSNQALSSYLDSRPESRY